MTFRNFLCKIGIHIWEHTSGKNGDLLERKCDNCEKFQFHVVFEGMDFWIDYDE